MNRFNNTFAENRKALVAYITVGLPGLTDTAERIAEIIDSGADIIELGVPFSDPTADGTVIQAAGQHALAAGFTFEKVLLLAAELRRLRPKTPLVIFSYYNLLFNYGVTKLASRLAEIGVDGVLAVDLPLEERDELAKPLKDNAVELIPLLAPTTDDERAAAILAGSQAFAYCITVRGVTGARSEFAVGFADELCRFKRLAGTLPVAAGFGIASPEMAQEAAKYADAVVVGSALMSKIMDGENPAAFIRALKAVL